MTSKYMQSMLDDYQVAYDIGLDCLDKLSELKVNEEQGLIALLTVVCHATFYMAPSDRRANELIEFAIDMARKNWAVDELNTTMSDENTEAQS